MMGKLFRTIHPGGKRFAVLKAPGTDQTPANNKVNFIFYFFDELRQLSGKNLYPGVVTSLPRPFVCGRSSRVQSLAKCLWSPGNTVCELPQRCPCSRLSFGIPHVLARRFASLQE